MENQNIPNDSTSEERVSARSTGVKFGLYNAGIGLLLFFVPALMAKNPFDTGLNWVGFGVTLVLIFLAHKYFKNNGDGYMNYGGGVAISFWIALISTLITVPVMYIYLNFIDPTPFDLMLRQQEDKMIESGAPEQAIEMGMKWTKMLFWPLAVFFGLLFTVIGGLIVSIFTKNSRPEMPI